MNYQKAILSIVPAIALSIGFAACSSDDENENRNVPEREAMTTFDDLYYFQDAFIETDSLGKFVAHCVGEPIYENDPTHLYIGVENIEEALEYWDACLAPDITRTTSAANVYNYTLTDEEGQSQGTVSFAPGTESGHVAEITTNATDLKYFKTVTFLLNSAWPFNSEEGKYHLGDVRHMDIYVEGNWIKGDYNGHTGFVCVREKSNGVKPLYVAITKDEMYPIYHRTSTLLKSDYCPAEAKAKQISELLRKDWELFEACFDDAGEGPLKRGWLYWYDKRLKYFVYTGQGCINLSSGELDTWDVQWHEPEKHVLLKIDWEND